MFRRYSCTNCGHKLRFNRRDTTWYCDNCSNSISMEEMVQREYLTPSGSLKPEAVTKVILTIIVINALVFAFFIIIFFLFLNIRHNVTISVYSEYYNGTIKIYIDEDEVYSAEIVVGETLERTFSLSGGRHGFTISYGDEEINFYREIDYDEDFSYKI